MIAEWENQLESILTEFHEQVSLQPGQLLVVGCSTSEVIGKKIGTSGTFDVAEMIFRHLKKWQQKTGIELAFQCCEHLNRALVVEKAVALKRGFEEVTVIPVQHAGGSMATYAYRNMEDPTVVEFIKADAGIDIGGTLIGMHLKHVAVPIRVRQRQVGYAQVTLAKSRPKLIGGARAVYEMTKENASCQ